MTAPAIPWPDVLDFELPDGLEGALPTEERGLRRDQVRLLVARRSSGDIEHRHFFDLAGILAPGDLVVVNASATLPAALPAARPSGELVSLHLSTHLPGGLWAVELRRVRSRSGADSTGPVLDGSYPERLTLPGNAGADLLAPYQAGRSGAGARLRLAALHVDGTLAAYLDRHGGPIRYCYDKGPFPLSYYQTAFASEPGSAEMPSAGRPFTPELVTSLIARGVGLAPIVLHTGVSSPEAGEAPYEEKYRVPAPTADAVNATKARGGRVIAVGTTVVRALETVADERGRAHPGRGWTDLVVTPGEGVRVADGLITGWHEPRASHLALVEAIGGRSLTKRSYEEALATGYLWHEFGDLHLLLP